MQDDDDPTDEQFIVMFLKVIHAGGGTGEINEVTSPKGKAEPTWKIDYIKKLMIERGFVKMKDGILHITKRGTEIAEAFPENPPQRTRLN